ncbi:MAG: PadR family transcriptional regulator [Actinophytocola sp.]|nr:PadR family transcriptional regulator [Actinophytocola sp.]
MSIGHALLALLEAGPRHGYDLKRAYDIHLGADRPLHYGQVYSTLSRLLRNGLVEVAGLESGDGPDRKRYAITDAGITDVESWLAGPERPEVYLQNVLYAKVVLALLSGRDAQRVLDTQRAEHLKHMRELTKRKSDGDLVDQLICDHALFHLEADLRWLELTAARIDQLREQVRTTTEGGK